MTNDYNETINALMNWSLEDITAHVKQLESQIKLLQSKLDGARVAQDRALIDKYEKRR